MRLGEIIRLLAIGGEIQMAGANLDMNETSEHKLVQKHWKEVSILPYIGIDNNVTFLTNNGERFVTFSDGTRAKVVSLEEKPIFELEKEIREIYGTDPYSFAKKWYQYKNKMDSLYFVVIKSEKV